MQALRKSLRDLMDLVRLGCACLATSVYVNWEPLCALGMLAFVVFSVTGVVRNVKDTVIVPLAMQAAESSPPGMIVLPEKYAYDMQVTRVIDGDTFVGNVDLGMHVWLHDQVVRFARVNAPELSTPTGPAYRDWLSQHVLGDTIVVRTQRDKKEKYGRWLGEVWDGGVNLNDELIEKLEAGK